MKSQDVFTEIFIIYFIFFYELKLLGMFRLYDLEMKRLRVWTLVFLSQSLSRYFSVDFIISIQYLNMIIMEAIFNLDLGGFWL